MISLSHYAEFTKELSSIQQKKDILTKKRTINR